MSWAPAAYSGWGSGCLVHRHQLLLIVEMSSNVFLIGPDNSTSLLHTPKTASCVMMMEDSWTMRLSCSSIAGSILLLMAADLFELSSSRAASRIAKHTAETNWTTSCQCCWCFVPAVTDAIDIRTNEATAVNVCTSSQLYWGHYFPCVSPLQLLPAYAAHAVTGADDSELVIVSLVAVIADKATLSKNITQQLCQTTRCQWCLGWNNYCDLCGHSCQW